jgi:hypothetical protein
VRRHLEVMVMVMAEEALSGELRVIQCRLGLLRLRARRAARLNAI